MSMMRTALFTLVMVAMVTTSASEHPDHPPEQTYSKSSNEACDDVKANWKLIFRVLDVNHDNILNRKDAEYCRSQYIFLHEKRGQLDTGLLAKFDRMWSEFVFGDLPEMTLEQYLDNLNHKYTLDKDEFESINKKYITLIMEAHDTNFDKHMSWDEFVVSYVAFGLTAISKDYAAFLAMEPMTGVPISRYANAWTGIATGADSTWSSVLKDTLEKDGFE